MNLVTIRFRSGYIDKVFTYADEDTVTQAIADDTAVCIKRAGGGIYIMNTALYESFTMIEVE